MAINNCSDNKFLELIFLYVCIDFYIKRTSIRIFQEETASVKVVLNFIQQQRDKKKEFLFLS